MDISVIQLDVSALSDAIGNHVTATNNAASTAAAAAAAAQTAATAAAAMQAAREKLENDIDALVAAS